MSYLKSRCVFKSPCSCLLSKYLLLHGVLSPLGTLQSPPIEKISPNGGSSLPEVWPSQGFPLCFPDLGVELQQKTDGKSRLLQSNPPVGEELPTAAEWANSASKSKSKPHGKACEPSSWYNGSMKLDGCVGELGEQCWNPFRYLENFRAKVKG